MSEAPTTAQLLTTLLATESFLLAVVGLAVSLSSPVKGGVRRLVVSASALAWMAAALLALAAIGAVLAWIELYCRGGKFLPFPQPQIAGVLILIIVLQPIFAFLVASGTRYQD